MAIYTRRDHFTAALLMISTIEIVGLLSNRLFLGGYKFYIVTTVCVALVGFLFYNTLHKYRASLAIGVALAAINLVWFFRLIYYISSWNGCKNWDGLLLPDVACGFKFMLTNYLPWLIVKPDYLIWFISELLVIA